jgi:hypothetical protein
MNANALHDPLAPLNDQLEVKKSWWILEFCPVEYHILDPAANAWHARLGMNLGVPRPIMGSEPNLHWAVRHRMLSVNYKHKAIMEKDAV